MIQEEVQILGTNNLTGRPVMSIVVRSSLWPECEEDGAVLLCKGKSDAVFRLCGSQHAPKQEALRVHLDECPATLATREKSAGWGRREKWGRPPLQQKSGEAFCTTYGVWSVVEYS